MGLEIYLQHSWLKVYTKQITADKVSLKQPLLKVPQCGGRGSCSRSAICTAGAAQHITSTGIHSGCLSQNMGHLKENIYLIQLIWPKTKKQRKNLLYETFPNLSTKNANRQHSWLLPKCLDWIGLNDHQNPG